MSVFMVLLNILRVILFDHVLILPLQLQSPSPPHKHRKFGYHCLKIFEANKPTNNIFIEIKIKVVKNLGNLYNRGKYQVKL